MPSLCSKAHGFLDLPGEVRDRIYYYLGAYMKFRTYCPATGPACKWEETRSFHDMFLTCRTICNEARLFNFDWATLQFDKIFFSWLQEGDGSMLPREDRRRVKILQFSFCCEFEQFSANHFDAVKRIEILTCLTCPYSFENALDYAQTWPDLSSLELFIAVARYDSEANVKILRDKFGELEKDVQILVTATTVHYSRMDCNGSCENGTHVIDTKDWKISPVTQSEAEKE